jgi:hypothetical protein
MNNLIANPVGAIAFFSLAGVIVAWYGRRLRGYREARADSDGSPDSRKVLASLKTRSTLEAFAAVGAILLLYFLFDLAF